MLVEQMPHASEFLVAWLPLHQENLEQNLWFFYAELNLETALSIILAVGYDSFFVTGCLSSLKKTWHHASLKVIEEYEFLHYGF